MDHPHPGNGRDHSHCRCHGLLRLFLVSPGYYSVIPWEDGDAIPEGLKGYCGVHACSPVEAIYAVAVLSQERDPSSLRHDAIIHFPGQPEEATSYLEAPAHPI